jgi:hypothetical protein
MLVQLASTLLLASSVSGWTAPSAVGAPALCVAFVSVSRHRPCIVWLDDNLRVTAYVLLRTYK